MFIQIIQGTCRDSEALHRQMDTWSKELGSSAEGWLGGTYGITDDDIFMGIVRFESKEAAARNSARPEQDAWWAQTAKCFDGEVTFHDCDNALTFLDGGADDAGFVQVIQGKVDDPEKVRRLMEQPMDLLQRTRPRSSAATSRRSRMARSPRPLPSGARKLPAPASARSCPLRSNRSWRTRCPRRKT